MLTAESRAKSTINSTMNMWEKTKVKLDNALDILKGIITKKNEKISKMKTKIVTIEDEISSLSSKIDSTGNYITNMDKMFDAPK